jgi:transcriptional regulator with XRE-family HTH domain
MPVDDESGHAHTAKLGVAIRELRESLDWSQSRLATALCTGADHETVTRETVSRWANGKRVPGPWWLRHLATVLQVPLDLRASWRGPSALSHRSSRRDHRTLVVIDLIGYGFAALHGGYPTDDDWGHAVDTYGRDYMTSGAGEIQKRLAADLAVLHQQLVLQQQLDTTRVHPSTAPANGPSRPSPSTNSPRSVGSTPLWARPTSLPSVTLAHRDGTDEMRGAGVR